MLTGPDCNGMKPEDLFSDLIGDMIHVYAETSAEPTPQDGGFTDLGAMWFVPAVGDRITFCPTLFGGGGARGEKQTFRVVARLFEQSDWGFLAKGVGGQTTFLWTCTLTCEPVS